MEYTVADLNSYDPKTLNDFDWEADDQHWHALWCGEIPVEGESVPPDELEIGDVVIIHNGLPIQVVGRVVELYDWGHNQYEHHPTFEFGLDTELSNYPCPWGSFAHENTELLVIRYVDGDPI